MNIEKRLSDFKRMAFENSVRLFIDAALLFQHHRFPTAAAIATTAFEELGKVHVIDRGCDSICLNPEGFDYLYELYFKGEWLTDHLHKQRQALFDAVGILPQEDDALWVWVNSGGLEVDRRVGLYVEMTKKGILTTDRITKQKAKRVIDICYKGLKESGDIAYSGFDASSSNKSEWLANRAIEKVKAVYQACNAA